MRMSLSISMLTCLAVYAQVNNDLNWQDVYLVNNSDYALEVAADLTGISNINNVEHETHPVERTIWIAPKKIKGKGAVIKLDTLNLLHNISIRAVAANESKVPLWAQATYPLRIKERKAVDTLIIYIGQADSRWIIKQAYVQAVKIEYDSPSGYSILIDQP